MNLKHSNADKIRPRCGNIDREKLCSAVRRLDLDSCIEVLDDAIALLSATRLEQLAERHFNLQGLRASTPGPAALLAEVRAFDKASRAGEYYEDFRVNSKNYMEVSGGTKAWIAECERLLACCVRAVGKKGVAEMREAFEIVFALLRHVDEGLDDVVFFADEGGSWQVGVDWDKVLPAWFACLAMTVEPQEFSRRVVDIVDRFASYDRDLLLSIAAQTGSMEQKKALEEKCSWKHKRTSRGRTV